MYQNDAERNSEISDLIAEILREDQAIFDDLPSWKSWSSESHHKDQMSGDCI